MSTLKRKGKITHVKSGIGFSKLVPDASGQVGTTVEVEEAFITSRTARVLLAGAGFLADAVSLFIYLLKGAHFNC